MTKNKTITLPKIFSEKDINFLTCGKGNKEWEKHLGKNKISYSDINVFLDDTYSSNPLKDFVLQKFLGKESEIHPEFSTFGKCVEDYITTRNEKCGLSKEEMEVLSVIQPLGTFQAGFLLDFNDFVLVGLQDDICVVDCDNKKIRDYKTASLSSWEKRYKDSQTNMQLQIYALNWLENHKILVDNLELVVVEREGNPFKSSKLKVGKNIWVKEFTTSKEELLELKEKIIKTVELISQYYSLFLKMNI